MEIKLQRQISAALATGVASERILLQIAKAAKQLCQADMAAIGLLAEGGREVEWAAVCGKTTLVQWERLPVVHLSSGRRSISSSDGARDRRQLVRDIARQSGAGGMLAVPILDGSITVGLLWVGKRSAKRFPTGEAAALHMLADSAGVAIGQTQVDRDQDQIRRSPSAASTNSEEDPTRLTPRQREILHLLMQHRTCKSIGSTLGISVRTAEHHVERLKLRLRQSRLSALIAYAIKHEL